MGIQISKLSVEFIKENNTFVAFCPSLDLSTCGNTFEEAKANFEEAVAIFFEECLEDGTLVEVLTSLGWKRGKSPRGNWVAPPVVGRLDMPISIPA